MNDKLVSCAVACIGALVILVVTKLVDGPDWLVFAAITACAFALAVLLIVADGVTSASAARREADEAGGEAEVLLRWLRAPSDLLADAPCEVSEIRLNGVTFAFKDHGQRPPSVRRDVADDNFADLTGYERTLRDAATALGIPLQGLLGDFRIESNAQIAAR